MNNPHFAHVGRTAYRLDVDAATFAVARDFARFFHCGASFDHRSQDANAGAANRRFRATVVDFWRRRWGNADNTR